MFIGKTCKSAPQDLLIIQEAKNSNLLMKQRYQKEQKTRTFHLQKINSQQNLQFFLSMLINKRSKTCPSRF